MSFETVDTPKMSRVLSIAQRSLYVIGCKYVQRDSLSNGYTLYRIVSFILLANLTLPLVCSPHYCNIDVQFMLYSVFLCCQIFFQLRNDVEWGVRAESLSTLSSEFIIISKVLFVHYNRKPLHYVLTTILADVGNGMFLLSCQCEYEMHLDFLTRQFLQREKLNMGTTSLAHLCGRQLCIVYYYNFDVLFDPFDNCFCE